MVFLLNNDKDVDSNHAISTFGYSPVVLSVFIRCSLSQVISILQVDLVGLVSVEPFSNATPDKERIVGELVIGDDEGCVIFHGSRSRK